MKEVALERIYFDGLNKNVGITILGKMEIFGKNSSGPSQKPLTIDRVKGGMNHLLEYMYDTDEDLAIEFIGYMHNVIVKTEEFDYSIMNKNAEHGVIIKKKLYKDSCALDKKFMYKIIEYTIACGDVVDTYDASKSTSLKRTEVNVLNVISVYMKICFVFFLLHGNKRFNEFLEYNIWDIVYSVCGAYKDYIMDTTENRSLTREELAELEYIQEHDVFDAIYAYIASSILEKWTTNNTDSHIERFKNASMDELSIISELFIRVISSLKGYTIIPRDEDVIKKYFPDKARDEASKEPYDHTKYEWSDFGFIHNNLTSYLTTTMKNIAVQKQKQKIESMISASTNSTPEDAIQSRIGIYYEDRFTALVPHKQNKVKRMVDECSKVIFERKQGFIKNRIKSKNILSKSLYNYFLNTMYGESYVMADMLGDTCVYPITVVYMTLERMGQFPNICMALMSNASSQSSAYSLSDIIREFSDMPMSNYAGNLFMEAIFECTTTYHYKTDEVSKVFEIPLEEIKYLFQCMQDSDYMYEEFHFTLRGHYPNKIIPDELENRHSDVLFTPIVMSKDKKQGMIDRIHRQVLE